VALLNGGKVRLERAESFCLKTGILLNGRQSGPSIELKQIGRRAEKAGFKWLPIR
jgi:hypothetical protein